VSSTELTQFVTVAVLCFTVLIAAVLKARRHQLNIRYAAGWMLLSTLGMAAGALIPLVGPVADALGVAAGVIVFAAATVVLVALTMQLSISLSGALRQNEILAIQQAISRARPISDTYLRELIVIPAWNEAGSIGSVVSELRALGFVSVVVDDGSNDDTAAIAEAAGATVISLPFNLGVGAAVRCGLAYAKQNGVQRVIQCDADGQHPVDRIGALISTAEVTGADLVIGSRFHGGAASQMSLGVSRRLAMRVLAGVATRSTGSRITDATSGFRVISQPLLEQLARAMPSYYLGDTFESYVAAGRAGYTVVEVHAPIVDRKSGSPSTGVASSLLMLSKAIFLITTRLGIRLSHKSSIEE
jgi:hypothetical protein